MTYQWKEGVTFRCRPSEKLNVSHAKLKENLAVLRRELESARNANGAEEHVLSELV